MFSRNPDEFLRCFVTVDETWIHHNTPETKEQSKQWVSRGERGPKKAKQSLSANKVMATVFWDARGVIHIDYLEKGKTITGEYYSKLLDRFDVDLTQKRPHLAKKKVLFHQDNARVHTCLVTMAKIHELRYELLPHPAYSPELALCDYYLFPNLKKWLDGKRFESNKEVITETNAYFESLKKTYYLEGIKKLEKRWTKCIELKGNLSLMELFGMPKFGFNWFKSYKRFIYIHTRTHASTHAQAHTRRRTCTHAQTHTKHTRARAHTNTRTYTHTQGPQNVKI
ncbi:Histone-lysine N-methyltransferase SETMAR [Eumeta japonica]|uniref:Histone-lysine N-methyltransferase SETMAR n=1 Tax=Eumeta variegata TaxID=151549 RepID=A0A4C1V6L6_EUMVA|nr:Histone-lysine N-methyltransferase SETMAR [Eumeta japonica]